MRTWTQSAAAAVMLVIWVAVMSWRIGYNMGAASVEPIEPAPAPAPAPCGASCYDPHAAEAVRHAHEVTGLTCDAVDVGESYGVRCW